MSRGVVNFRPARGSGRPLLGTWVKLPITDSVELLALAGFDFVVIDMEHAPLDVGTVHTLLGAARGRGLPALVRVPDHGAATIARVLDSGAAGVLVPHVENAEQARALVAAGRFPPYGTRGYGPTVRAGGWGTDPAGYRTAAAERVLIPQLESRDAIAAAPAIAAVEGVGALFVGPADLAVATGLAPDSAAFRGLIDQAERAADAALLPIGTAVGADAGAGAELARRYGFVLLANDASLLVEAASTLLCETRRGFPACPDGATPHPDPTPSLSPPNRT